LIEPKDFILNSWVERTLPLWREESGENLAVSGAVAFFRQTKTKFGEKIKSDEKRIT